MTHPEDYSVRSTDRGGEVAGPTPVAKHDNGYLRQPPRRNGRKARPRAPRPGRAAGAIGRGNAPADVAPAAPQTPEPVADDHHVDYYI
ncbi:MAG: hypothetical protein FJ288_12315 [Planctomycetes bacterium]|nr:hypothetical protein [Planctomycetota bacterium]